MDRRFSYLSFLVLLATGCQQSPYVSSHLEILGAERRALEDRVLDLEFELERAEKKLSDYQDGGRSGNATPGSESSRDPASRNADDGESMLPPAIEIPGLGDGPSTPLTPPSVNEGQPVEGDLPSPTGESAMSSPRYRKPTRPVAINSQAPGDPRITHIALNSILTGGTDFDRKSGDDGLIVVLEPRNSDNEFVPLAGPITVVLLDYAKRDQGSDAMVARWKIDAPTVHKSILNDEYAQGIQLRLPWPKQTPEHSKLRLDVRYTTADGRHLDARSDVFITLPGQFSIRWTPRGRNSGRGHDGSPTQAPINIARQPNINESAGKMPLPTVVQSAFTTVAPATDGVTNASGPLDEAVVEVEPQAKSDARPTWRPYR